MDQIPPARVIAARRHAPLVLLEHANDQALIAACAQQIARQLATDLADHSRVLLALSGGTTPGPVYRALSGATLDWTRVVATPVDERWVASDDPGSNARLLRETLLTGHAARATFWPLAIDGASAADAVALANRRWRDAALPLSALVLGMGDDGHTASLFPGATELPAALAATVPYATLDATGCPGAGAWSQRLTLTPLALAAANLRVLIIKGAAKRAVLQRALAGEDVNELPVRVAIAQGLQVHWCP
jgi:6-phosphogluconolactonase